MRSLISRSVSIALVAGSLVIGASSAGAAPGNITSATVTPPAALNGLSASTTVSSRDGGMYYAYASGTDYKVFKAKPDGTQDTTFGTGGVADAPGVVTALTGNRRVTMTSDLNGRWWLVNTVNSISGTVQSSDIRVIGGGATGAPDVDFVIPQASSWAWCSTAYPDITGATTWNVQGATVQPKRGGGLWISALCTGLGGASTGTENRPVLVSYTDKGVQGSAAPVGFMNALGSTSPCYSVNVIADPTGATGSPEIYAVRTEHTKMRTGSTTACDLLSSATAAEITGYSIVKVASDASTSTWKIPSVNDTSDGFVAPRIDPGGRVILVNTNVADTSKLSIRRIKTDGTLDTTIGTGGITTIDVGAAPAGQTSVTASVAGIITSPTKVYLAIALYDMTRTGFSCVSTTQLTLGYRMVVASPSDGVLGSWGTSGVGDRSTLSLVEKDACGRQTSSGRSVDTDGRPRLVRLDNGTAILDVWTAPADANGGGEGGTGSGGPTTDTGGAPSKGDGLQVSLPKQGGSAGSTTGGATETRVDAKVYTALPATSSSLTALTVLTGTESRTLVLVSRTPATCVTVAVAVLMVDAGACTVRVTRKTDGETVRTLRTTVSAKDNGKGTTVTSGGSVSFAQASWTLSASALKTLSTVATSAAGASRVVVVAHAAALYDTRSYNFAISAKRAAAVKKALKTAGVKSTITTVNAGWNDPVSTKKTESAQSKNRRAVIYLFPAAVSG